MPQGTNYNNLLSKIDIVPEIIFEVGAKDCFDTITIATLYNNAMVYSYECNPIMINDCKQNIKNYKNVIFNDYALGNNNEYKYFNVYAPNGDINKQVIGASSFFSRPDHNNLIQTTKQIKISTLDDELKKYNIKHIDILCMDVQGYELNILNGAKQNLSNIQYIIMEQPKSITEQLINQKTFNIKERNYYIGAPTESEIINFMTKNNFEKISSLQENLFENNVLYKNLAFVK